LHGKVTGAIIAEGSGVEIDLILNRGFRSGTDVPVLHPRLFIFIPYGEYFAGIE
jgi:hypothetical protein